MIRARVSRFDARRGSGQAITTSAGRKLRIPLSALRNAGVFVLSPGDEIFVEIDAQDRGRVEALFVPDS
jgi:cold shock CspA family protein